MFSSVRSSFVRPVLSRSFSDVATYHRFGVNKAKAAIQFSFNRPTVELKTAAQSGLQYNIVKNLGSLRLELAAANTAANAATNDARQSKDQSRSYNWAKKQIMQLSCNEIGDLLAFGESTSEAELKLYHDPSKGSEGEGTVRKELVIKRAPNNKGVYFNFTSSVKDVGKTTIMCALTEGEFKTLRVLLEHALPHLMGMADISPMVENTPQQ